MLADQPSARRAADAVGLIDASVERPVLVFGSLPPGGRDLDLLARPPEAEAIAARLGDEGFVRRGRQWALFRDCGAYGVEVVPAAHWRLPGEELEALFAGALPIEGYERLVRPAPAHALLVLARRFIRARGRLGEKLRARVDSALVEQPSVWEDARKRAGVWRAERALELLGAAHRSEPVGRAAWIAAAREVSAHDVVRALGRRPKRPLVVSFSGLDGAGKSTQAAALGKALDALGVRSVVVWRPLGSHRVLDLIGKPAKWALGRMRFGPLAGLASRAASGSVMSNPDAEPSRNGGAGSAATRVWATYVVLLNLLALQRAVAANGLRSRVVIFDRHALDSAVRMRFLYGEAGRSRLQRGLLLRVAPRARCAYLLDIRPETSQRRKPDWTLNQLERQAELYREEAESFGVWRLDGERPRDELCALVAADVWRSLG